MKQTEVILIVDDLPAGRHALGELLYAENYRLIFAESGPEALRMALEHDPDLILLDAMMPDMDGFEVCRRLRADPHLAEVPIIIVTALDDQESRLQGIDAGADDFLTKPFNRAELRARVRSITRLNRYRRLHAERNRFEWIVEQSGLGFLFVTSDDHILYANPSAGKLLGIPETSVEEQHGKRVPQQPFPGTFLEWAQKGYRLEPASAWENWLCAALPEDLQGRFLVRAETDSVPACWLKVGIYDPLPGGDGKRLVRIEDVTRQILQSRDMWTFHGMIAHKLRTPLNVIVGGLDLLTTGDTGLDSDGQLDLLKGMQESAKRLNIEIRDILRFIKISGMAHSGEQALSAVLPELLQNVCADLCLEEKAVTVVVEDAEKPGLIRISQQALQRILTELLENSIKFHPDHSPKIEIVLALDGSENWRLTVRDDGRHLPSEQLSRAWVPYYQIEKFFTGQVEGMGLGLSMVASIVTEAGGDYRLFNREDRPGIVIELRLPREPF
ncbi:MAG: response regulator [Candidatus Ozemobacteraceae bacterium]